VDFYSRMVAFLKVLLPLAALGILSTLFLLSRSIDPTATIPFAEDEMTDRMRGQQVTAPFFYGTTANGDDITVTASLALPGGPDVPAVAKDLVARITMADGTLFVLNADSGTVAIDQDMATFVGNVRIETSSGFALTTELLNTALSGVSGDSPGKIDGFGPLGTFSADQMHFSAKNQGGPVHMVFKNRVKLVYDPTKVPER